VLALLHFATWVLAQPRERPLRAGHAMACDASSPVQQRSFLRPLLPRESPVTVGTRCHDFPHSRGGLSTSSVAESPQSP